MQAVSVEVVDRPRAAVLLAEDERGADHFLARHAAGGGNGLHQTRLAGAERAAKCNRRSRGQSGSELCAQAVGVTFVGGVKDLLAHESSRCSYPRAASGCIRRSDPAANSPGRSIKLPIIVSGASSGWELVSLSA